MKARNIEDLEKKRKSIRACILHVKRYAKYFFVVHDLQTAIGNPQKIQTIVDSVPIIAHDISSGDFMLQFAAVHKMEFIMVQLKDHAATQALVQRGIVPHLLRFLGTCPGYVQITVVEVLYKLINESPEQAQEIIDHGGAPIIVGLLHSRYITVKVRALGAMACAQDLPPQYRDALLKHGAATELTVLLEPLVELPMLTVSQGSEEATLLYRGVQSLPGLCSGDPLPEVHLVEILVPSLRRLLLLHIPIGIYTEIITDACVTLYYILENLMIANRLQDYVNAELCESLLLLMQGTSEELDEAIHLIFRNLISSQALFQVLMDKDLLQALNQNLYDEPVYQAKSCKTIFAIIYYRRVSVQAILDEHIIHRLLEIIQDGFGDVEVKELAVSILAQAVRHGTVEDINLLVDLGCIQPLCEYLNNIVTRAYCIIGLRKIIQKGNEQRIRNANIYAGIVGEVGGDTIRALQNDGHLGSIARWIMMHI
ncbi:importin subunit alpha-like [Chenopodium quinoa]|uniref:importin subunit alpha-like n=1 Tax=Chenopodium quinoa TaxID=63459 RepID=UPI000B78CF57|nr:importin subunit alpha-like [Chenopodium quinoa]